MKLKEFNTKLYHLSYDIVSTKGYESNDLKKELVELILSNQGTNNYYLDSPCGSAIIFESENDFNFWKNKFSSKFSKKMIYQISSINSDIRTFEYIEFHSERKSTKEKSTNFIEKYINPALNDLKIDRKFPPI